MDRIRRKGGIARRPSAGAECDVVEDEPFGAVGQQWPIGGEGEPDPRTGIGEHVIDAVHRMFRIDRQEGRADLRGGPHADKQFGGARETERHYGFRSAIGFEQQPGQLIRLGVELAIGRRSTVGDHCGTVRVRPSGCGERLGQCRRPHGLRATDRNQLCPFGFVEDIDIGETHIEIRGDRGEYATPPRDEGRHRARVEKICRIGHYALDAIRAVGAEALAQIERQVEL